MTEHTPGPLRVVPDTLGSIESVAGVAVAQAHQTAHAERMANARLLVTAYNSYDALARKTGGDAVEMAEGDLLGELFEANREEWTGMIKMTEKELRALDNIFRAARDVIDCALSDAGKNAKGIDLCRRCRFEPLCKAIAHYEDIEEI